jgi:hypothetical protein
MQFVISYTIILAHVYSVVNKLAKNLTVFVDSHKKGMFCTGIGRGLPGDRAGIARGSGIQIRLKRLTNPPEMTIL